jgi:CPA1 family monovalent cation:H+ antiporter
METTTVIVVLIAATVLTNILDGIFESLPLPLIQLAVGFIIGFFSENMLELEPEIFMALVIAPLLFRESEEADLLSLWRVRRQVFFMAFLLVFITVAGIGFAAHLLIPSLPLAACFALGAVLGPTDYVAVASLSSKVKLPDVHITVLKGEALINDASGLISLKFAVAALATGAFSPADASVELAVLCVGGFLVGYVVIIVRRLLMEILRRMMIHYVDTHVLIELLLPFLSYVTAEFFGFSGILAAVTADALQALDFKKTGSVDAEIGNAEKTTWNLAGFVLNAIAFLMLGVQMPAALLHVWENPAYNKVFVIAVTIITTFILYLVRFLSLSFFSKEVIGGSIRERLRNTLILTLAGVKGVVAIAAALSVPAVFAHKPLMMFISAGTITLTLVLALFLLPFVTTEAPKKKSETGRAQIRLLHDVMRQLRNKDGKHLGTVIANYQKRIKELEHARQLRGLFWNLTALIIKSFEDVRDRYSDRLIAIFIEERVNLTGHLIDDACIGAPQTKQHDDYADELLIGYDTERETIRNFLNAGKLTASQANELRANVNRLESHMLADSRNDVMLKLISVAGQRRKS